MRAKLAAAAYLVIRANDSRSPTRRGAYEKAQAMTRQLGNARLLTRDGDGHTAYESPPASPSESTPTFARSDHRLRLDPVQRHSPLGWALGASR